MDNATIDRTPEGYLSISFPGGLSVVAHTATEAGIAIDHWFYSHDNLSAGAACPLCRITIDASVQSVRRTATTGGSD